MPEFENKVKILEDYAIPQKSDCYNSTHVYG